MLREVQLRPFDPRLLAGDLGAGAAEDHALTGADAPGDANLRALVEGALDGVRLQGTVLAAGVDAPTVAALQRTGAEVVRWERYGSAGTPLPPDVPVDRVLLRLPRGRRNLAAMVHVACAHLVPDGRLWLVGANDEGVRSAGRTLQDVFADVRTVDARKHGRLLEASGVGERLALEAFFEPVRAEVAGRTLCWEALPGGFAEGRLDVGTRALLEVLEVPPGSRVLDVGCGAGPIGVFLGDAVDLEGVDHDAWAVASARRNLGRSVHQADVWPPTGGPWDRIVSNPPFHTGDRQDFRVVRALVAGAPARLAPGGALVFVVPATAPVREPLAAAFREVRVLREDRSVRVWEAR